MTKIQIPGGKLEGVVAVPPSKSMAHRAIICASLAKGVSRIDHIEYSDDINATINALVSLGTKIDRYEDYLIIDGTTTFSKHESYIDCKESGSTLRFMVPIALANHNKAHFVGEGNLGKRPLDVFYKIFDQQGIQYSYQEGILDLHVEGKLYADTFYVPGNISSQFISGLLFTLPLLDKTSKIVITTPLESKGYIDLTLQMLETFGVHIENHDYKEFIVDSQSYKAHDYYVEADYSQAAFYLVAGALNNNVVLKGLNLNSLQGDKVILDLLKQMGCFFIETEEGIQVVGDILQAIDFDGSECPDIIPIVSLALALADGTSHISHIGRLRIKECDRLLATATELKKLGVEVEEGEDYLVIHGAPYLTGASLCSYNDHRMTMMEAIASTVVRGKVEIDNKECVKKSYPSFFEDFEMLGGVYNEC